MKKVVLLVVALVVVSFIGANAQVKFGAGLALGSKAGISDSGQKIGFGANLRADYSIPTYEAFGLSGGLTFFLPSKVGGDGDEIKQTLYQVNLDSHYSLLKKESLGAYALLGANYSFSSAKVTIGDDSASATDSKIGADLGLGVNISSLFVEGKYDTAFEQVALTVGVRF